MGWGRRWGEGAGGGLVEFINEQRGQAKVKDNKVVIRRDWGTDRLKIQGAFAVARDLAAKVKEAKTAKQ